MSSRLKLIGGAVAVLVTLVLAGLAWSVTQSGNDSSGGTVQGSSLAPTEPAPTSSDEAGTDSTTAPGSDPAVDTSTDSSPNELTDPSAGTPATPANPSPPSGGTSSSPDTAMVNVPDVSGLSVADAVAKLQRSDLQPFELLPTDTGEPGVVDFTTPSFGLEASAGEPVTLYVGAYKKAKTPDLQGLPVLEATNLALTKGLELFAITPAPTASDSEVSPGEVAFAVDDAKQEGKPASGVSLSVVPEELSFEVPALNGMNFALADYLLRSLGLNPVYDSPSSPTAVVTASSLDSATSVSFGDDVTLTLSSLTSSTP